MATTRKPNDGAHVAAGQLLVTVDGNENPRHPDVALRIKYVDQHGGEEVSAHVRFPDGKRIELRDSRALHKELALFSDPRTLVALGESTGNRRPTHTCN